MRPVRALALLALALTAACAGRGSAGTTVRVGVIVPLTSGVPGAARSAVQGAQLAADEVNADRGAGRRLVLTVVDDRGVPEEATRLFAEFAAQEVVAVVGPLTDPTTIAAAPAAERHRLVLISPGATGQLPYGGHYVFRTALPARTQAQAVAAHLVERLGLRRIAIVHDSNDYGTTAALTFADAVRRRGGQITSLRLYRDGDRDFTRHARGPVEEGAQAVFLAGYPDEGAQVLRALRAVAPRLVVAGSDALYSPDTLAWAGEAAAGLYVPAGFAPDVPLPLVRDFVARYRERFGQAPDQFAAQAYDAVRLVAFAVRRGGPDRVRVREAVAGVRRFPGVTGELAFDRWGDPVRDVIITRVEGGRFSTVGP